MFLTVDLTEFFLTLFSELIYVIQVWFRNMDDVIIFNGETFGLDFGVVSILDLSLGVLVVGIVLGAFLRFSKADKFYGNR